MGLRKRTIDPSKSPKMTRRKVKARMEDVMVVPMDTWRRLGEEQRKKDLQIEGLTEALSDSNTEKDERIKELEESNSALGKELVAENKLRREHEQTIKDLREDNDWLEHKIIPKLEEDLKFEKRRSSDVTAAFSSVSEAAAFTSQVSLKMVRLMDDLEVVIKGKQR